MQKKAVDIIWDTDDEDLDDEDIDELPNEIEIPDEIEDDDDISDYISDQTGFCHKGYNLIFTEYAVNINNSNGFVRQIDVFDSYEDASSFCELYPIPLNPNEYLNIMYIDYDEDGNEIASGNVF